MLFLSSTQRLLFDVVVILIYFVSFTYLRLMSLPKATRTARLVLLQFNAV